MKILRNFNIKYKVMKTYSSILMLAVFALALGGCGTAYQAQTPDAVYYSPTENQGAVTTTDDNGSDRTSDGTDQGQYVTYQDSYNGGYANDYDGLYSQPASLYGYSGSYGLYNSYAMMSPYSYGYGLGWNPFAFSMPSLSLMFSMGSPWGGFYRPLAYGGYYNPYMYGGYYGGYGGMYYPGYYSSYYPGYGYGYGGGKYLNANPRPAGSYGPRTSSNSRAAGIRSTSVSGSRPEGVSAPRRTFGVSGTTGETTRPVNSRTTTNGRRVFRVNPNERPVNVNTNTRVSESRTTERPRRVETNTRTVERQPVQRQQPVDRPVSRPQRTFEVQRSQPSYSAPSNSAPRSAPTRSFSPRGR